MDMTRLRLHGCPRCGAGLSLYTNDYDPVTLTDSVRCLTCGYSGQTREAPAKPVSWWQEARTPTYETSTRTIEVYEAHWNAMNRRARRKRADARAARDGRHKTDKAIYGTGRA